ncbi:MAG: ATP-binding cassette domain-containing protein [Tyzzerella sp.]|nr:ATP-binding cassette domain-containing protein [Tyzzerella sp.]
MVLTAVKRKINELSLGNRKKVSIICAMQHRPKLFLFDEPTSGLDPLMQNVFFELIQEYVDEGATCMLPMAVMEENITEDIYETAKLSINHSKVKTGMPSDVSEQYMKKYKAPTLVMAAEKDCLFPAKGVIPRAERIIENCTTYLLEGRGHMSNLTEEEKQMIVDFLKQD